jgi:hypothetical protein
MTQNGATTRPAFYKTHARCGFLSEILREEKFTTNRKLYAWL